MPTRNYSLVVNAVLGTNRELSSSERYRLRREITIYLNRNFKMTNGLHDATDGQVSLTGPGYFRIPGVPR